MDALIFGIMLVSCCGFAFLRGGAPERIAATLLLLSAIGSLAVASREATFSKTEWGIFAVDCALFAGLFALAMFSNRYWPLWLAAFQLVTIWSHLAFGTLAVQMPLAYAIASTIWSLPMLIILASGTQRHRRRKGSSTEDPPWYVNTKVRD